MRNFFGGAPRTADQQGEGADKLESFMRTEEPGRTHVVSTSGGSVAYTIKSIDGDYVSVSTLYKSRQGDARNGGDMLFSRATGKVIK